MPMFIYQCMCLETNKSENLTESQQRKEDKQNCLIKLIIVFPYCGKRTVGIKAKSQNNVKNVKIMLYTLWI